MSDDVFPLAQRELDALLAMRDSGALTHDEAAEVARRLVARLQSEPPRRRSRPVRD
ncbi:hypothetical protein [Paracoccus marinus]|uniref:hypothetical protein n=1 Tax=Paracoccus marinus TaxID=288426 RepID=UPI00163D5133|nr:hypothetical protein [Paracoccus marinus]